MGEQRKGQKLYNYIAKHHELRSFLTRDETLLPAINLHKILFYMSDKEFNEAFEN